MKSPIVLALWGRALLEGVMLVLRRIGHELVNVPNSRNPMPAAWINVLEFNSPNFPVQAYSYPNHMLDPLYGSLFVIYAFAYHFTYLGTAIWNENAVWEDNGFHMKTDADDNADDAWPIADVYDGDELGI